MKKTLQQDFYMFKKQYKTLGKLHSNLVERNSELNTTHVAVLRVKDGLLSLLKAQAREVKCLNRLVDAQLEKKLKHKIDTQEMMCVEVVKQLALEETCERSSNASAAPKTPKK
jgi:isopropylmalate/homocitrate/citramalate synthase